MIYDIAAKPTIYKGRLFRSRLEAKWAAFFDLSGWHYEYEPSEMNGRNPDFLIKCTSDSYVTKIIIVEVKPSIYMTPEYINEAFSDYDNLRAHLLFLTDTPFYFDEHHPCGADYLVIGTGYQLIPDGHTELTPLDMKCMNDFGSSWMNYDGMVFGKVERKMFIQKTDYGEIDLIQSNWNEAGNMTMFLKP